MSAGAWILVAAIAYVALGSFVGSGLRRARERQTRPVPQVEAVRDPQLDITPALRGRR